MAVVAAWCLCDGLFFLKKMWLGCLVDMDGLLTFAASSKSITSPLSRGVRADLTPPGLLSFALEKIKIVSILSSVLSRGYIYGCVALLCSLSLYFFPVAFAIGKWLGIVFCMFCSL